MKSFDETSKIRLFVSFMSWVNWKGVNVALAMLEERIVGK